MIKFFRKIRYDLMEKNKTGKYFKYAIGEIVLVVLGILIALQINNWNENRLESQEEKKYLDALKNEITANINILDQLAKSKQVSLDGVNYIMDHMENNPTSEQIDSIYSALGTTMNLTYTILNTNIYNEMESSGKLQIIRNENLKQQIIYFYSQLQYINKIEELGPGHFWNNTYAPFTLKYLNTQIIIDKWADKWADEDIGFHQQKISKVAFWSLDVNHPLKIEFMNALARYYGGNRWVMKQQIILLENGKSLADLIDDNQ